MLAWHSLKKSSVCSIAEAIGRCICGLAVEVMVEAEWKGKAIERGRAYELRRLENVLTTVVITLVSAIDWGFGGRGGFWTLVRRWKGMNDGWKVGLERKKFWWDEGKVIPKYSKLSRQNTCEGSVTGSCGSLPHQARPFWDGGDIYACEAVYTFIDYAP